MSTYAPTYWFTWAFLVLAAALTGVASLQDAFFGGIFASALSAVLAKAYAWAGPRYAPMLGAFAGTGWVILMFLRQRWFGEPAAYESAQWTLGTDISVHAAGFAGAGLMTALRARHDFGKALSGGLALATAMTAVPYGVIAWIDTQVAGPVEVVLLVSADVSAEEGPVRRAGAVRARLSPEEITFVRERYLVVEGPGGTEVVDEDGRRFWPLWRRRLTYPGNPSGPVRTLLMLLPPGLPPATWEAGLSRDPAGRALAVLGPPRPVSITGGQPSQSVRLEVSLSGPSAADRITPPRLEIAVFRRSPIGDLYVDVRTSDLSAAFPSAAVDAPAPAVLPPRAGRPSFGPSPAGK